MFEPHKKIVNIAKKFALEKPLVIFSVETTGLKLSSDRIVEIAFLKILPNGRVVEGDYFFNPEMEINEEAQMFHGITDERVENEATFKQKAQEVRGIFENCFYAGYNIINSGLPFLRREFLRAGINFSYSVDDVYDAREIFSYMEPRTLSSAYKWYCGKNRKAHSGAASSCVAVEGILTEQFSRYKELRDKDFLRSVNTPRENSELDHERKFSWHRGEAHFNFSKYYGESLSSVAKDDPDFLRKILEMEFSEATKNIIRKALAEEGK